MSEVLERGQAGAPDSLWKTIVGKVRQIIVNTSTFRPAIHDGKKAGGYPLAFESELLTKVSSLSQDLIDHVLTVLGIYQALEELITENGGTVPTDTNSVSTASVQSESTDEFAEYDDE